MERRMWGELGREGVATTFTVRGWEEVVSADWGMLHFNPKIW